MKMFMLHVPYINVETSKIIGATEFCSSGEVSNSDDVIDFRMNYEQIPTKDAKSNMMYHRKLALSLSLMKRKLIQKLIFNERVYLKRII